MSVLTNNKDISEDQAKSEIAITTHKFEYI